MLCLLGTMMAFAVLAGCSQVRSMLGMDRRSASEQAEEVTEDMKTDAHVMAVLHESNLGEISAGNIARTRATDAEVRDFAAMMVRDHSDLDRQGSEMARRWMITPMLPDNTVPDLVRREIDALNAASSGTSFDRVYMDYQVVDHQRTLGVVDAATGMAQRPELRTMLRDQVRPVVASHLSRAQTIQARIGRP
jgi:putative membrane protein